MSPENKKNIGLTESESFRAMENLQEIQRFPSINPINLNYFGAEQCEKGYVFGPFVRTSYVIHIIRKGKGKLRKNGTEYEINTGQAFLIYPGEETTYQADACDPWSYMWIGFHGLRAEEMMKKAGFSKECPVITCRNMDKMKETMDRLLLSRDLTYVNELYRMGAVYHLIALLTENSAVTDVLTDISPDADRIYVDAAVNLLINNANGSIKVSEVARRIGISRSYLTSIFKKEMKVSPQEFLMNFRMEKAASLLRSTDNSVNMIASEVGYSDALSFSKLFHKRFGVSPTDYRRQKPELVTLSAKGDFEGENYL